MVVHFLQLMELLKTYMNVSMSSYLSIFWKLAIKMLPSTIKIMQFIRDIFFPILSVKFVWIFPKP